MGMKTLVLEGEYAPVVMSLPHACMRNDALNIAGPACAAEARAVSAAASSHGVL